jgi:hypothetical protein
MHREDTQAYISLGQSRGSEKVGQSAHPLCVLIFLSPLTHQSQKRVPLQPGLSPSIGSRPM